MLLNTLVVPYLTYCIEIWGTAYKTNIKPVFILQKRAIRIISGCRYRDPSHPLFVKLQLLKFEDLLDYNVLKLMYKAHKQNQKVYQKVYNEDLLKGKVVMS